MSRNNWTQGLGLNKNNASLLVLILAVFSCHLANSQTTPQSIVLPPANWDIKTHRLYSLLFTNRPGKYQLPATWAGTEKLTARTGTLSSSNSTNESIVVDTFVLIADSPVPHLRNGRFLSQAGRMPGSLYRASLPSDYELLEMRDTSATTNLFGYNPFSKTTNFAGYYTISSTFFTLRPYDSIELLRLSVSTDAEAQKIKGIMIKRCRLHAQSRQ